MVSDRLKWAEYKFKRSAFTPFFLINPISSLGAGVVSGGWAFATYKKQKIPGFHR